MYTIAEVGQAHDGSLGILHSYIDALASTGVDAVKFQVHIADAESSIHEPFRVKFSYEDDTRYDYWKRMGFTYEQWEEIKSHCDKVGLDFIASPFSNLAVGWLEKLGVKYYKIGSGEVNNLLMLEKIAKTKIPVILSSGMSSLEELETTVSFLKAKGTDLSILQCTTAYPTAPDSWGLNVIKELKSKFNVPTGFSDHSGDIFACLSAAVAGAEIFEFHVVFDKRMFGPDASSSLEIDQVEQLIKGLKQVELALSNPVDKKDVSGFKSLKSIFEKSLCLNKSLTAGAILTLDDLESKKPKGYGIDAADFKAVIGKQLSKDVNKWDFLNWEDLND